MQLEVTTYYLDITDPSQLRPKRVTGRDDLALIEAQIPLPEMSRFLYTAVGGDWFWTARIEWTYEKWQEWLAQPGLRTWVFYVAGIPAGYFELVTHSDSNVEIEHFGLIPHFVGEGLGGHLLTQAIETAWAIGGQRVWLHTCSHDHPNAVNNYLARGMRIYKEEIESKELPDETPGPWPGAR
jgi:GNAT superfamily N-acetyltransferase